MSFLYLRSGRHQNEPLKQIRRLIQPPVDLGFYKILELDGVPRAAVLWAFLNPETEHDLVHHGRILPKSWLSGDRMWIVEIIAPYNQQLGATAMNWLRRAVPEDVKRVRYMRTTPGRQNRIVEVSRGPGAIRGAKVISPADL
ncbi:hypothetical protein AIOL_000298 [Candidatus Rhodobacter oscarellae]|uniref:RTX toxin-activating lysine-acyltransferase n=1 Tax=Candidatus Rhodobacter oscarellae TaxID=1675527 RepID=A0A0J9EBK1_9RHOB|nr:hypothetical protein AIOL_000298 [Candidatus Rhodobacter lobularis]